MPFGLDTGTRYVYEGIVTGATGDNTCYDHCDGLLIRFSGCYLHCNNIRECRRPDCGAMVNDIGMNAAQEG